jgi:REP-associated tyrosine transposase
LIETPEPNLVAGMRRLNGIYTQAFNRRHGRVGHVFQGRYKSILVDQDSYGLELSRYIVLNPVRARMVKRPEHWVWSSYRATAGRVATPAWLNANWVLAQLGGRNPAAAYERFVREGMDQGSPWDKLKGQIWLGSDAFFKRMERLAEGKTMANVPRAQQRPTRPTAQAVTAMVLSSYRIKDEKMLCSRRHQEAFQAWIYLLRRAANLSLREVAARGKVSPSRVSKIQRALETGTAPIALQQLLSKCKVKN